MHEASLHEKNSFVTLTYRESDLPPNRSLDVKDWQNFVKRARRSGRKFRYYHCGEYGDVYGRPHYHACLFGLDFGDDRKYFKRSREHKLYTSKTLDDLWELGHCQIGSLTFESAAYVARYVMKKVNGEKKEDHYGGRKPEYTTMSRNKGIGSAWIAKFGDDVYRRDEVIVNGKKTRPPRYYDGQYESTNPEILERVKGSRAAKAKVHGANNTPERLDVRERVQEAKYNQYSRDKDGS